MQRLGGKTPIVTATASGMDEVRARLLVADSERVVPFVGLDETSFASGADHGVDGVMIAS